MALVVIGIGMATIDFLQDNQCSPNNGSVDLFDRKLGNMVHVIVQRNSCAQKLFLWSISALVAIKLGKKKNSTAVAAKKCIAREIFQFRQQQNKRTNRQ